MKGKDSREAKGYAFVTFRNKEFASKAIEELNDSKLKVINEVLIDPIPLSNCSQFVLSINVLLVIISYASIGAFSVEFCCHI